MLYTKCTKTTAPLNPFLSREVTMPANSTDKKVTCSCLRAELGIYFLSMEAVLTSLYAEYPDTDFARVNREQFPDYYRVATNNLIRELPEYKALAGDDLARVTHWMENRCTMCSYLVLRHIQEQLVQEAA